MRLLVLAVVALVIAPTVALPHAISVSFGSPIPGGET